LVLAAALLTAVPALSQGIPTGTLTGRVTADDQPVGGVAVAVTSAALQGRRSATTNSNGDYTIPLLPPGDYQVLFSSSGFQDVERTVKINAAQSASLDVVMPLAGVEEVIEVSGSYETISSGTASQATYPKEFIEDLPMERNVRETVLLNAGVNDNGPRDSNGNGAITIAGAQSNESLFLVNGVVVNENLRGQALTLFIEDAIQETTTSVSGISAEYGRFAGGVVNAVTKSGGNSLSGSLRTNFTNDKWVGTTPLTTAERTDSVNERFEATLGGSIVRDHLWYFLAGRQFETNASAELTETRIPYTQHDEELRAEGKLTLSLGEGHRVIGTYLDLDRTNDGNNFDNRGIDLASLDNRELPQELLAVNYTGVLTNNFYVEGQYSERYFAFVGSGSDFTDRTRGTWFEDGIEIWRYNSPTFCGVCNDEERNNESVLAKGSWFLSTPSLGSHDVAFGYETFNDIRFSDNFQSGSNFSIFTTTTAFDGTVPYPVMVNIDTLGFGTAVIVNWPIAETSKGTDFRTNSFYVNDRWRLNDRWSFNLGVRYDQNDGKDAQDKTVADDSRFSPRLGITYDLRGDGDWLFNAGYGHYVTALANNISDSTSTAGTPSIFVWFYDGPNINFGPDGSLLTTTPSEQALQTIFDWFDSVGGVNNSQYLIQSTIPGGSVVILDGLKSPYAEELTLGVVRRLGNRGMLRADVVSRDFHDFYAGRTNLTTGRVTLPSGAIRDRTILGNDDSGATVRSYLGLHTQVQYRLSERLNLGAVYTLSKSEGNFDGETAANGPITSAILGYPEYKQARWNSPEGYLGIDQRHRLRIWGLWDIFEGDRQQLTLGFLQNFSSGTPYGAVGAVNPKDQTGRFGVRNPGYATNTIPATVTYFYTDRDAFRTEDITSTDLSLNYSFDWDVAGRPVELFLQPEVLNVFGEHAAHTVNTAVNDSTNTAGLARFNPFTEQPVEGVNWRKGPNFGEPTSPFDFQQPRTFRFSVGVRF
jgi:outer membrane receptor protein involved in Fe transport